MSTTNHSHQNRTEKILAQYLATLLEVETIGLEDNLFTLGIDSVLIAIFINRVRDEFNVEIPIHAVFQTPTIEALSRTIQTLQHADSG